LPTGIRRSDARWFKADSPFQIDFSFLSAQKKNTKSFDLVYGREQILPSRRNIDTIWNFTFPIKSLLSGL
jgi:hypothetical protein